MTQTNTPRVIMVGSYHRSLGTMFKLILCSQVSVWAVPKCLPNLCGNRRHDHQTMEGQFKGAYKRKTKMPASLFIIATVCKPDRCLITMSSNVKDIFGTRQLKKFKKLNKNQSVGVWERGGQGKLLDRVGVISGILEEIPCKAVFVVPTPVKDVLNSFNPEAHVILHILEDTETLPALPLFGITQGVSQFPIMNNSLSLSKKSHTPNALRPARGPSLLLFSHAMVVLQNVRVNPRIEKVRTSHRTF